MPGMSQELSWTIVNLTYLSVSMHLPNIRMVHWRDFPALLSDVPLGYWDTIPQRPPRWSLRWINTLGANRRRSTVYTIEEMASMLSYSAVCEISLFPVYLLSIFSSFLASTHYTHYNPWHFAINMTALILALIPKLPMVRLFPHQNIAALLTPLQLHRQRVRFLPEVPSGMSTPRGSDYSQSGEWTPPSYTSIPLKFREDSFRWLKFWSSLGLYAYIIRAILDITSYNLCHIIITLHQHSNSYPPPNWFKVQADTP